MKSQKFNLSRLSFYCIFISLIVIIHLPISSIALQRAQIAIYDDTASSEGGAWVEGLIAIGAMLDSYGYSHIKLTPDELNQTDNLYDFFQVIIFGGGWAGGYNTTVTEAGFDHLRTFVSSGGGYFGICAGAYFAADIIYWKPNAIARIQRYDYPLNLFPGAGIGSILGIAAWTDSTGCTTGITRGAAMTVIKVNSSLLPNTQSELPILYFGGPFLIPFNEYQEAIQVIARYQILERPAFNEPAMVLFPYGSGKVFLSGPHPEISFNANDCILYYDANTWALMNSVMIQLLPNRQ